MMKGSAGRWLARGIDKEFMRERTGVFGVKPANDAGFASGDGGADGMGDTRGVSWSAPSPGCWSLAHDEYVLLRTAVH